jgi:Na+/H+-dicarboxylate symporter
MPIIAAILTLVLAGIALVNWLQGAGRWVARLQYALLATAGIAFALTLHTWNLLGWHF